MEGKPQKFIWKKKDASGSPPAASFVAQEKKKDEKEQKKEEGIIEKTATKSKNNFDRRKNNERRRNQRNDIKREFVDGFLKDNVSSFRESFLHNKKEEKQEKKEENENTSSAKNNNVSFVNSKKTQNVVRTRPPYIPHQRRSINFEEEMYKIKIFYKNTYREHLNLLLQKNVQSAELSSASPSPSPSPPPPSSSPLSSSSSSSSSIFPFVFEVVHIPSDKSIFEKYPNGFIFKIFVSQKYINFVNTRASSFPSSSSSSPLPSSSSSSLSECALVNVEVLNTDISSTTKKLLSDNFVNFVEENFSREISPLFSALKFTDKKLEEIIKIEEEKQKEEQQKQEELQKKEKNEEWTEKEQERLETALIVYRRVNEARLKWRLISEMAKTRNAKECMQRYLLCRTAVLKKRNEEKGEGKEEETSSEEEEEKQENTQEEEPREEEKQTNLQNVKNDIPNGLHICLDALEMRNVATLCIHTFRMRLQCRRCEGCLDASLTSSYENTNKTVAVFCEECTKCHRGIAVRLKGEFAYEGKERVGLMEALGCFVCDFPPSDYLLTCLECSAHTPVNNVFTGKGNNVQCHHCNSKMFFSFKNISALQPSVTAEPTDDANKTNVQRRVVQSSKRGVKDEISNRRIGEPLPLNGTCKHYKKSYRWLRFPCCGKAYACDVCHDSSSDHVHEWATRMICGFCSRESSYSQNPCSCGKNLTSSSRSAHWEGGKGCRDAVKLSRKDSRKYKLLHKQQTK